MSDNTPRTKYKQTNSNTFHELKCKSLMYMSSFFPGAITFGNNAITHFNDIPSFTVLKNHAVFIGISAHGRLNFEGLFLAHKRPWALIWVGAYLGGRLFGWALIWVGAYLGGRLFGWALIWVGAYLGGRLFGWALIWVDAYLGGRLFGWALIWVGAYLGGRLIGFFLRPRRKTNERKYGVGYGKKLS